MFKMKKCIKIIYKSFFLGEDYIGHIDDPNFIIPLKGDIININEEQIRIWNSGYTDTVENATKAELRVGGEEGSTYSC